MYVCCSDFITSQTTLEVRAPLRWATPTRPEPTTREVAPGRLSGLCRGRTVHCTSFRRKALFDVLSCSKGLGHAERIPKLCMPPVITPMRSGGCVPQRATSSSLQGLTASDSCRQQSRHVRLRDTPQSSEIAPERSQPTPHTPQLPLVSLRTTYEPLQSRGGLAWVRVPKAP